LRYHGGKLRLAPKLIAIFPPHRIYSEVFGGGASVLMQKPRCYSELYNDLDGEVVNAGHAGGQSRRWNFESVGVLMAKADVEDGTGGCLLAQRLARSATRASRTAGAIYLDASAAALRSRARTADGPATLPQRRRRGQRSVHLAIAAHSPQFRRRRRSGDQAEAIVRT
jgi:hypothetical protein